MALARSASGPGGLSINTSSANSLFGSGTKPAAEMFGSTQASKPLLGGSTTTTTTTAPQTGGLFGATTGPATGGLFGSTTTAQPAAGGLFGSSTTQPQTGGLSGATATTSQPQTGGLFGAAAPTSQPQSGGLFGSTAPAQPTGGLFGNTNTSNASQPAPSGGLFSNIAQPQNAGGGLFGNTASQPAATGGGLFSNLNQPKPAAPLFGGLGTTQNQQNQSQPSTMFSSSNQQQPQSQGFGGMASGFGGGLTMGQSNNQQPQTVPGVRIDTANIRGTTRFNDLHDELQNQIEHMDKIIQQQIQLKNDCYAIMPAHGDQLSNIPNDAEFCRRKLIGLDAAMSSDVEAIVSLQKLVTMDQEHGKLSFRAVDNLKLPAQYHVSGGWPTKSPSNDNRSQGDNSEAHNIVGYFSSTTDELSTTLSKYQNNITEIEQHLRNVEGASAQQIASLVARRNGGSSSDGDAARELAAAFVDFEQGILHVAGKVGGARESLQTLQLSALNGWTTGTATNGRRSGVY